MANVTLYNLMGGDEGMRRIADTFYDKVSNHPEIKDLFPKNLDVSKEKMAMYLTQFLGGPSLYSEKYGPPMMRRRHLAFPVTPEGNEAWLACMEDALKEHRVEEQHQNLIMNSLRQIGYRLINRSSESIGMRND